MLSTMVQNLVRMRKHRLSHGDMKPPNLLITPDRTVLLDLDGVRQHTDPKACERALAKDTARWIRWWEKNDPQPRIGERSRTLLKAAGFAVN
jgi:serine/threonine-protein kinase RIO1